MNIYVLDYDVKKCAAYHCDKHVVKMLTEYVQILSTVSRLHGLEQGYKPTHINHPSVKWAAESKNNWLWLYRLASELYEEYKRRYGKAHKSGELLKKLKCPKSLPDIPRTEFKQVMEPSCKREDPVEAYRLFYNLKKREFARWKNGSTPEWFINFKKID